MLFSQCFLCKLITYCVFNIFTLPITASEVEATPPIFTRPLENATATDGQGISLICEVKGQPAPDITWYHNHKNIGQDPDFIINYNKVCWCDGVYDVNLDQDAINTLKNLINQQKLFTKIQINF